MEECYEFLCCKKTNCIMYGKKDGTKCWKTRGTLCHDPDHEVFLKYKLDKCMYCEYYKKVMQLEE